ncbi:MAG TPA: hypothetical protein VKZ77_00430 [Bacillaceae bacterium]|nr:hypothetical protein [Paenibacillus bovis]HLU20930.1 hypothetical protein [Bacillaceae bacterium]
MKKKFNQYTFYSWKLHFKAMCRQLIVPFTVFQAIRTLIFPTVLDVLILATFIATIIAFHNEWI